jgi:hypothetical protein
MALRLTAACALGVLLITLSAAPSAAKEGVVARVLTPIARDAEPGSRITVVWTLTFDEAGERRPFGGGWIYVRLYGPNGATSRRAWATNPRPGRFRADVKVPRGGVRRVELGIMGTACDAEGCRPSPKTFPIVGRVFR